MARRERSRLLRRLFAAWVALSTFGLGLLVISTRASAATQYDVVNITVNASSVHVIGNSNAFPNFRTGAVDNSYAYAHAHVDASPFAEGRASPLDTGPLVQLQAAQNGFHQPQYVDSRFPPGAAAPQVCGSQGVNYAESYAHEGYAFAQSSEATTGGENPGTTTPAQGPAQPCIIPQSGSAPAAPAQSSGTQSKSAPTITTPLAPTAPAPVAAPGKLLPISFQTTLSPWGQALHKLNLVMLAWRARWMSADDAARHPMVFADADTPDGADGIASVTKASFDEATGLLSSSGDSRVARLSLGGGAIVLHGIHSTLSMTDDGSAPTQKLSIGIADATIGGVPVLIDQTGVSVAGNQLPGLGDQLAPATQQLNAALAQAGWKISSLAPEITTSTGQKTIEATAAHISYRQPAVSAGVPQQYADIFVGEVFGDMLGTVTAPLGPVGGGGLGGVGGTQTQFLPGTPGTPGTPGSLGTGGTTSGAQSGVARLLKTKPLYLLLLYFLWQAVIIGTGASLWWLRMGGKPA